MTQLFFPEGTQPCWKIMENSRGWGVWQAPPGMEIREGEGGSKAEVPSVGWYEYFSEHIKCKAIDMVSIDMKKLCLRLT